MKKIILAFTVQILLMLPASLLAQTNSAKVELPFDKAQFKELNHEMLKLFSTEINPSPLMSNYIYISPYSDYGIRGLNNTAGYDSLILKDLVKEFDASSFEKIEKRIVKSRDELFNYFLDNLKPRTIISFRVVTNDKIEVKRYQLIPKNG